MTVETSHDFDASFEEMYRNLTNRDFLQRKYEGVGSRNVKITECGLDEDVFRIEWSREVPADPPAFARKFFGEWNRLDEIMEWSLEGEAAHADYEARIRGVPGTIRGEFDLRPVAGGCVEDIVMEASVSIPLLGGKIEKLMEEDVATNLQAEYEFTVNALTGA
jgi:hypothetical protein